MQRMDKKTNKMKETEKKKDERMQEFILTYPSGVSSEEGNKMIIGRQ